MKKNDTVTSMSKQLGIRFSQEDYEQVTKFAKVLNLNAAKFMKIATFKLMEEVKRDKKLILEYKKY